MNTIPGPNGQVNPPPRYWNGGSLPPGVDSSGSTIMNNTFQVAPPPVGVHFVSPPPNFSVPPPPLPVSSTTVYCQPPPFSPVQAHAPTPRFQSPLYQPSINVCEAQAWPPAPNLNYQSAGNKISNSYTNYGQTYDNSATKGQWNGYRAPTKERKLNYCNKATGNSSFSKSPNIVLTPNNYSSQPQILVNKSTPQPYNLNKPHVKYVESGAYAMGGSHGKNTTPTSRGTYNKYHHTPYTGNFSKQPQTTKPYDCKDNHEITYKDPGRPHGAYKPHTNKHMNANKDPYVRRDRSYEPQPYGRRNNNSNIYKEAPSRDGIYDSDTSRPYDIKESNEERASKGTSRPDGSCEAGTSKPYNRRDQNDIYTDAVRRDQSHDTYTNKSYHNKDGRDVYKVASRRDEAYDPRRMKSYDRRDRDRGNYLRRDGSYERNYKGSSNRSKEEQYKNARCSRSPYRRMRSPRKRRSSSSNRSGSQQRHSPCRRMRSPRRHRSSSSDRSGTQYKRCSPKGHLQETLHIKSYHYREQEHNHYNSKDGNRTRSLSLANTSDKSTEREVILQKWKSNYCSTREEVSHKIEQLSKVSLQDVIDKEKKIWTRTTPADLYYVMDESNPKIFCGTEKLQQVCDLFHEELVLRSQKINSTKPKYEPPPRKNRARICKHRTESHSSSDDDLTDEEDCTMEELQRKQKHPDRLHPEMWYNDPGEMNDGPLCRCSIKSRKSGIRHGIYPGEQHLPKCDTNTNNANRLYHYRITISPPTNFLIKTPTIIQHDEHEFIFEGFSVFSHCPLEELPTCKVIRFNIKYDILYIEEKVPDNFTVRELDLFSDYLFKEILELVDLDLKAAGDADGCPQFHFMPRFVRELPDNGKEILSMNEVLQYLLNNSVQLISSPELEGMVKMSQYQWQAYADAIKGMVVTYPGKKPCSVRVDQLDRNIDLQRDGDYKFPEIVHFGIRPPQLSYAGNPDYQKAWRDYVKFRHLLANMSKPTYEDKRKLEAKENKLQEMRTQGKMKRDVTIAVSSEGFYRTGIMCDIIQHAMLVPVLVCHLRFHQSLDILETSINYQFKHRNLLQLALTHPSYRENFGTNPDHARNSLTNCGIRQPEYGDRRIHYMNTRKRGINTLINIMSRFGKQEETESNITHNERLEFLGDAVVEFLTSIHLFYSFPDLEEGGLATYRAAIVQNQHLAVLARVLNLDQYMLYAHGSDLCHDLELRHAMANCFEALMGALFLDGGIDVADRVFCNTLYKDRPDILEVWSNFPPHPLQEQEPTGDRDWIAKFELLQKLTKFEESIGVRFNHIRLLARAFTDRSVGYTNLTLGSNQRLEFLGDTVLQLIASEYLYKFFPEHHEGHLSLLRSSLVNNRTQAVVCDDLGMAHYAVYNNPKAELKTKDRADLLEAFIGALYVDQGLKYCEVFCQVTLFPRLQDFIMNQDWNDPKSKLQQCCLTLRTMDGGEPDIPVYKVIECKGPTNTRVYTVAVYFRGRRLASAMGHSIQQAEMNAAKSALELSQHLFPQLDHQKRVIAKSMKKQRKRRNHGNSVPRTTFGPAKSPERYSRARFSEHYMKSKLEDRMSAAKRRRLSRDGRSTRRDDTGPRDKRKTVQREYVPMPGTSRDVTPPRPSEDLSSDAQSSCDSEVRLPITFKDQLDDKVIPVESYESTLYNVYDETVITKDQPSTSRGGWGCPLQEAPSIVYSVSSDEEEMPEEANTLSPSIVTKIHKPTGNGKIIILSQTIIRPADPIQKSAEI